MFHSSSFTFLVALFVSRVTVINNIEQESFVCKRKIDHFVCSSLRQGTKKFTSTSFFWFGLVHNFIKSATSIFRGRTINSKGGPSSSSTSNSNGEGRRPL